MPASAGQAAENQRGDSDSRADLPGNHSIDALFDYLARAGREWGRKAAISASSLLSWNYFMSLCGKKYIEAIALGRLYRVWS